MPQLNAANGIWIRLRQILLLPIKAAQVKQYALQ